MSLAGYTTIEGYEFTILDPDRYRLRCPNGCLVADDVSLGRAYEAMSKHMRACPRAEDRVAPPTQVFAHEAE